MLGMRVAKSMKICAPSSAWPSMLPTCLRIDRAKWYAAFSPPLAPMVRPLRAMRMKCSIAVLCSGSILLSC